MADFLIGILTGVAVFVCALAVQWWQNVEYTRRLSRFYLVLMSVSVVVLNGIVEDAFDIFPPLGLPEWVDDVTGMIMLAFLVLTVYVRWHISRNDSNSASETPQ